MIEQITFIMPNHNTLPYMQLAYKSIKQNSILNHKIIILDDNSNDGSKEWLLEINKTDEDLTVYLFDKQYGHTVLYDIGIQKCQTEIFSIFHTDMYMSPYYDQAILKHMDSKTVISATRIEPPLHPAGSEKIIKDFGLFYNTFDAPKFQEFVSEEIVKNRNVTSKGIFAPWAMYREDYLAIGGHDFLFAPYPLEDSDIFQRFILAGYEIIQARDAFVYHFTCRGHKLTDDKNLKKIDNQYTYYTNRAQRNFIRKWGMLPANDENQYPIFYKKLDIGFHYNVEKFDEKTLYDIEPFANNIYLDIKYFDNVQEYVKKHQSETTYDLASKFEYQNDLSNDIVIRVKWELDNNDMRFLYELQQVININKEIYVPEEGVFVFDDFNEKMLNSKYPNIKV